MITKITDRGEEVVDLSTPEKIADLRHRLEQAYGGTDPVSHTAIVLLNTVVVLQREIDDGKMERVKSVFGLWNENIAMLRESGTADMPYADLYDCCKDLYGTEEADRLFSKDDIFPPDQETTPDSRKST